MLPALAVEPPIVLGTTLQYWRGDKSWQTLYMSTGHPTAIVRRFGNGSIALLANGYLLSNQALIESRDTELLASLIRGPPPQFTFDENHFGISQTGSIVALARKLLIALWRLVREGVVPEGVAMRPA